MTAKSIQQQFILLDQTQELKGSESLLKNLLQRAGKITKGHRRRMDNRNPMLVFFSIQLIEPQSDVFHAISRFILNFLLQLFQFEHIV